MIAAAARTFLFFEKLIEALMSEVRICRPQFSNEIVKMLYQKFVVLNRLTTQITTFKFNVDKLSTYNRQLVYTCTQLQSTKMEQNNMKKD
jgi:hypothetical protein